MNSLSELTIIIPSYERQKFLLRQVDYWKNKHAHVIILDGSKNSIESEIKPYLSDKTTYYHLPITLEERFKFISDKISTNYSVLLSDDEFYTPSALIKCIKFLKNNLDYVAVKGTAMWFKTNKDEVIAGGTYPKLIGYEIAGDSGEERMIEHMKNYQMATLWSVMPTKLLCATLFAMGQHKYSTAAAGELQTSLMASYYGKVKVIDDLMWLRSLENKNIWWSFGNLRLHEWWYNKDFHEEHEKFLNATQESLKRITDNFPDKKSIVSAINAKSSKDAKGSKNSYTKKLKRKAKSVIKGLFTRLSNLLLRKKQNNLLEAVKHIKQDLIIQELKEIEHIILKHNGY